MKPCTLVNFILGSWTSLALAKKRICPLQGQQWPSPTDLSREDLFQNATKTLQDIINANITTLPYNESTFSIGMFSTTDDGLLWQYHHTDTSVNTSLRGTKEVDADSIYRIASISKIFTIYMWLINDGDRNFNAPITNFLPELSQYVKDQDYYAAPSWEEITVNDLAMFLAGVARDCRLFVILQPLKY